MRHVRDRLAEAGVGPSEWPLIGAHRITVEGGNAMPEIKTELLFKIVLEVPSILDLGETPYGHRRIARVGGGTFEGPKTKGRVLDGGGDWLLLRRDGGLQLDVRLTLET